MYGMNGYSASNTYSGQQSIESIRVDGRAGVENVQMGPNGFGLFLDKNKPILWVKSTDQLMFPTITGYELVPLDESQLNTEKIQNGEENELEALKNRITELERMVRENVTRQSDTSAVRRDTSDESNRNGSNKPNRKYENNT